MVVQSLIQKIVTQDIVHKYITHAYYAKYDDTRSYWDQRYTSGGTSGEGSYGELARFKAETLESIFTENDIESVIEFGCGDGNQLEMTSLPEYIGLDISPAAIRTCLEKFEDDDSKSFFVYDTELFRDNHDIFTTDATISLDVIFHIIDEDRYHRYMQQLFDSAEDYVIIYSSNSPDWEDPAGHVKHRKFSDWPSNNTDSWKLIDIVENEYPWDPSRPDKTSRSDFYIFGK